MAKTRDLRIRVDAKQKELLEQLAQMQGYSTLSAYCRSKLFDDMSIHRKLNKILEVVKLEGEDDDN